MPSLVRTLCLCLLASGAMSCTLRIPREQLPRTAPRYPIAQDGLSGASTEGPPRPAPAEGATGQEAAPGPETPPRQQEVPEVEPTPREPVSHWSLNLGVRGNGISFGNARRWNGLRFNTADREVEAIRGVNFTLWADPERAGEGTTEGLMLGPATGGAHLRGVALGLAATVSSRSMDGIGLGGLATVSGGPMRGLDLGGLATVGAGGMDGIQAGGLACVADAPMRGVQLGGLATVSSDSMTGIHLGGLATVAGGDTRGIQGAGLALVSNHSLKGVNLAGLATVSGANLDGLSAAGVAAVANEKVRGIALGGFSVTAGDTQLSDFHPFREPSSVDSRATGLMLASYRVQAGHIHGIALTGLMNRSHEFTGLGVAAYNAVSQRQRGLTVGLFNSAADLKGVQIGLLNHVASNPPLLRWLPFINARF